MEGAIESALAIVGVEEDGGTAPAEGGRGEEDVTLLLAAADADEFDVLLEILGGISTLTSL